MKSAVAALTAAALLTFAPASLAGTAAPGYSDTLVASGLDQPTGTAFMPDGGLLVTEKSGDLELVDAHGKTTLITLPVCTASEMGLLGIALDPGFSSNGYVYLYRTRAGAGGCGSAPDRVNQVVRVTIADRAVDPNSLVELVADIPTGGGNHNGGGLRIGPDGKLYIGVGEIGTPSYSQSLDNCLGKVLRTELDGTPAAGNPFSSGCTKIYALGLRNPFRFGFDPVTGWLWLGDVGGSAFEELDIIAAAGNYGWPICEGPCSQPDLAAPVFSYSHDGPDSLGRTVIGGAFANFGTGYDYFFADFISSNIYRAVPNGARDGFAGPPETVATDAAGPVDLIAGPDGAIYYAALATGEIRRLQQLPSAGSQPSAGSVDKTPPAIELHARRAQDIDHLSVAVELNEAGTIAGSATVQTPGNTANLYRFKHVKRSVTANHRTRLHLKLRAKARRSVKRALHRGLRKNRKRLKAKVAVTARDPAGNATISRVSIRLRP